MRNVRKIFKLLAITFVISSIIVACDDDDDNDKPRLTGESKTYTLSSVSDPNISGTVKFSERSDNSTVVTIDLNGTEAGDMHPAHIHVNTVAETGGIVIDLNAVNGSTGISETIIDEKNDGTSISYDDLLEFDGHVNVHLSEADMTTLIAQGDIGENELTSTSAIYNLQAINSSGITGTVNFTKRVNGTTLAIVDLDGASAAGVYPVYIYDNDYATTGPVAITLSNVTGATGVGYSNIVQLDNGTAITYDQLTNFDGHIMVSASPTQLDTYVAQSNIGSNN